MALYGYREQIQDQQKTIARLMKQIEDFPKDLKLKEEEGAAIARGVLNALDVPNVETLGARIFFGLLTAAEEGAKAGAPEMAEFLRKQKEEIAKEDKP